MIKKLMSVLLALMLLFTAAACGSGSTATTAPAHQADEPTQAPEGSGGEEAPAVAGEGQVLDGAGIVRDIPENPSEVSLASVYAVAVPMIVALDLSDRTLAINTKSKFWNSADEELPPSGTVGRGTVDIEALAECDPDVLIHRSNDPETLDAVEVVDVDVLCIKVENMDDVVYTLDMMGKYFGVEERAQEAIAWVNSKFELIDSIVATIPESERVTAMCMGGEIGRVAGNDMLQSWMIEKAGGKCAVDVGENNNWINVGVETIFGWDPDFIFCTSSTALEYTIDGLLEDPAWSGMAAIQSKNVFSIPSKMDSWDMPGLNCTIGTMFMLYEMYPEYFTAEQLEAEIDDYYTFMFGKTFEPDEIGYTL